MAAKNFTMKSNNGAGWDTLHPKTNMEQVEGLNTKIGEIEAIAKGASKAKVFDTVAELDTWLAVAANKATLQIGDNLLIKAKDVPDYWWDGTAKQELETSKMILENATASKDGLMTKGDKTKLDGIATGATKVTSPSDIGAATAEQGTKADNAVPNTRKVNNKALTADITLSASDVSAVPTTRKVNNKALGADITLNASDVGAAASTHTHAAADLTVPVITIGTTAPASPKAGDIWYDENNN